MKENASEKAIKSNKWTVRNKICKMKSIFQRFHNGANLL